MVLAMLNKHCLKCGGTGYLLSGEHCPDCKVDLTQSTFSTKVPTQYFGKEFSKLEVPEDMQTVYGSWMESMLNQILSDPAKFQQNFIIASRPNSGKTVWAYTLISKMSALGHSMPGVIDISDIRDAFHSNFNGDFSTNEWFTSRGLILKLPRIMDTWCFDMMSFIIEKRVRNNGFTVFLYPGSRSDIEMQDKFKRFPPMLGNGSFNTVHVYTFYS